MGSRGYIAVDLGAESGRVIVGALAPDPSGLPRLTLHEAHRFTHDPRHIDGGLHWDVDHIWSEVRRGLRSASAWAVANGAELVSVGVDAWGVDFALIDDAGNLLAPPRCYRDPRHESGMELLRGGIGFERLFQITGVQEMTINTLTQIAGAVKTGASAVESLHRARRLLFMPDYFHFLLSGNASNESSIASTSQMLDATAPASGRWSSAILATVGLPARLLEEPIPPGTDVGVLRSELAAETGLPPNFRVVAPASHDTASAVVGVPSTEASSAYISSGTWSLIGVELPAPVLTQQARIAGYSNERGVSGTFRFQKNIVGLWLVQEVRRDLERSGIALDYPTLAEMAAAAAPFRTRIDASLASLASPGDAIAKLRSFSRSVGDPEPTTPGELVRCCLEALAMAYRRSLEQLESILGRRFETIHIVGGGCKNTLLSQMTADATGRRVFSGPVEATAAGNVLVQAMADGSTMRDLHAIRATVARSFDLVEYLPRDAARWSAECSRHRELWELHQ